MTNVPATPLGEKRTVRIQWAPSAAPRIRKELVEDLLARELPSQVIDEAEIVVSELVANAIRHAKPLSDGAIRIQRGVDQRGAGIFPILRGDPVFEVQDDHIGCGRRLREPFRAVGRAEQPAWSVVP